MSDETRRVLDLLAQGKVTVDEAEQLLSAIKEQTATGDGTPKTEAGATAKRRFIRIQVHKRGTSGQKDKDVSIRVPIAVVRGGLRLGTMIPGFHASMNAHLRERGVDIDLSKIDPAMIESVLAEMGELNIDVNPNGDQVRITYE